MKPHRVVGKYAIVVATRSRNAHKNWRTEEVGGLGCIAFPDKRRVLKSLYAEARLQTMRKNEKTVRQVIHLSDRLSMVTSEGLRLTASTKLYQLSERSEHWPE